MVNGENWLRFRFVAPSIRADKGKISHDDAAKDIEHLCAAVAVPYIAEYDLKVIWLSSQWRIKKLNLAKRTLTRHSFSKHFASKMTSVYGRLFDATTRCCDRGIAQSPL